MNSWIWSFIFLEKFFILLISKCNFVLLVWRMFEHYIHLLDFDFKLICYLVVNAESGANVFKPTFYFGYISYRTSFTFLFFYSTLYSFSWVQNQNGQIINFHIFQKNVLKKHTNVCLVGYFCSFRLLCKFLFLFLMCLS